MPKPQPKDQKDQDDGWKDGEDFDPSEFSEEHGDSDDQEGGLNEEDDEGTEGKDAKAKGKKGVNDDAFPASIKGESESEAKNGDGKVKMKAEPHESGEGHRVHFHDEVNADLRGDADYQHHATEWAKHMAGHLINKDSDPDKAEAHRHAANLHARVGNALHAGGDTTPRRQQAAERAAELDKLNGGMPGEKGSDEDGEFPVGFGSDEWNDGEDVTFPGLDEESPGEDLAGQPQPAKPDKKRNAPSRDSRIEAKRRGAAPKLTFGKSVAKPKPKIVMKKSLPAFYTW